MSKYLYTIGHSNHSLSEFIDILHSHKINYLIDIRTVPKSHHVPWFNKNELTISLKKEKIIYSHYPELGGFRKPKKDSINGGWHNANFRGFADYMQSHKFFLALKQLNSIITKEKRVVLMCTEAVPWRCHRSLIADAEIIRHFVVLDIMSKTIVRPHKLTDFAVVNRKKRPIQIYYPPIKSD